MELVKIIGIGLIALIMVLIFREYKREYSIYIVLISGCIIFFMILDTLTETIRFVRNISNKVQLDNSFITLLIKITGISILSEFAVSLCRDCNENSIANKIELGGKIIVISLSIPVLGNSLEQLLSLFYS